MSNAVALHSQISSIMEVLTKAAVTEICKLVDDGYAVLRLEVSRSQQEIEALKRKLSMQIMGTSHVGKCERRSRIHTEPTSARFGEPKVCRDAREACFAKEEVFNKQTTIRLGCEPATSDKDFRKQPSVNMNKDTEDQKKPRTVCIKEEGSDEDPKQSGHRSTANTSMGGGLDGEAGSGEGFPFHNTQVPPIEETGDTSGEEHRSGHTHVSWSDSEFGASFKAEPDNEKDSNSLRLEPTGPGAGSDQMNSLSYEYSIYERSSQLDAFFTQVGSEPEGEEAVCSYATGSTPEGLTGHPELLPGPFSEDRVAEGPTSPGFHEEKPEVIIIDSEATEDQLSSAWAKDVTSDTEQTLHKCHMEEGRNRSHQGKYVKIRLPSARVLEGGGLPSSFDSPGVSGYSACEESLSAAKGASLYHKADTREKRFICSYCGKSFTCLKNLETHQRVHTGERPFSCSQCGKRFSQSAHLKKHQSVHTGEKPFACAKCGKRFADSSNLKRHQNVHTGERPFRCAQCGKRFSLIGNLKRHQSVHIGKKAYRSTMWEGFLL